MWGLGALSRRAGMVNLAYEGVESVALYSNACWARAHMLVDQLTKDINARYTALAVERRTPPAARGWSFTSTVSEVDERAIMAQLKRLKAEVERDLSRYQLPAATAVCLYTRPVLRAHEEMHALIKSIYPDPNPYVPDYAEKDLARDKAVMAASLAFVASISPSGVALADALKDRIPVEKSEEILAGLYGMVALWGRAGTYTPTEMREQSERLNRAFSSYMVNREFPAWIDTLMLGTVINWKDKFGTGLGPVRRALTPFFRGVR